MLSTRKKRGQFRKRLSSDMALMGGHACGSGKGGYLIASSAFVLFVAKAVLPAKAPLCGAAVGNGRDMTRCMQTDAVFECPSCQTPLRGRILFRDRDSQYGQLLHAVRLFQHI